MEQQEILYVDRGQFNFHEVIPKIPRAIQLVLNNRKNFAVAISEIVTMGKESKFQDLTFAYFFANVFRNLNEEKFISIMQPTEFFKDRISNIQRSHPSIEGISVDCKEGIITFSISLKQPDWDLEELIYTEYSRLLNQYKDLPFDIRINESFK